MACATAQTAGQGEGCALPPWTPTLGDVDVRI
mgnify:CR=1 FL=1|jgi:hypothetical protein